MDPLLTIDVELDRKLSPAEKLAQALEMMGAGIRLKRVALSRQFPEANQPELDRLMTAWLSEDD